MLYYFFTWLNEHYDIAVHACLNTIHSERQWLYYSHCLLQLCMEEE